MTSPDTPKQQSFDLEPTAPKEETETEKMGSESLSDNAEEAVLISEKMGSESLSDDAEEAVLISEKTTEIEDESVERSNKETREIVTPYAFTVSPDLLGQPLARPARRAAAISIDLFLISVLSLLGALVFAGFVALTFFRAGNRLKQQKRFNLVRLGLRACAAFLIFSIIFVTVEGLNTPDDDVKTVIAQREDNKENMESLVDLAAKLMDVACKGDSECILKYAEGVAIGAAAMNVPIEDINAATSDIVSKRDWSDENKSLFMDTFINTLNEERNAYTIDVLEITQSNDVEAQTGKIHSVIEWVKGIMSDLGLGLGWAALYFTVFTAWWRGQTIGKKLMGIEVVKLDGNYPSLWESFGRYGGYGAGFATGLLGFLQIYWDPNRQAIQDKISETLVLRLKRK